MTDIKHKFNIKRLTFPVDGYEFDVQIWISVDGGKNFYHCGLGKFCKTKQEAEKYINAYIKENPDTEMEETDH